MKLARFFLLAMAVLFFGYFTPVLKTYAAKTVPTFRIEIPGQKQEQEEGQSLDTVPSIPFDEEEFQTEPETEEEQARPDKVIEDSGEKDVTIFYGEEGLPEKVKETRRKLLEIAHQGDIEKLRTIFQDFDNIPLLSFEEESDPIEFLKNQSGDGEGREILAILLEVLESGYIKRHEEGEGEIFIWPYFVDIPPQNLKPSQQVELFRLITAGDFEDMQAYGTYIFYRAGITPDGQLRFFLAGD